MRNQTRGSQDNISISVIRGRILGVNVLRGYARLSDLAKMSKADIYDQRTNPTGTQRDLNAKHARDAYEYMKTRTFGFWPELFLCVRDKHVFHYIPSNVDDDIGTLIIDMSVAIDPDHIAISRVDGNHRLHYADGSNPNFSPIDKIVSFCLAYDLELEQEIMLFRDINANQRPMNTSHLDNIEVRLSTEERLKREDPNLFIATQLSEDTASPLFGRVFQGGKPLPGAIMPLRALRSGISIMLSRPTKLSALRDPDAQYRVIRNYFEAVKKWQPDAWANPKKYLLLRGAVFWAICFIGAEVIDRTLGQGKYKVDDMYSHLRSGRDWDWSNKGDFQGFSGQGGARRISDMVTAELHDEAGISVKTLFASIMEE